MMVGEVNENVIEDMTQYPRRRSVLVDTNDV